MIRKLLHWLKRFIVTMLLILLLLITAVAGLLYYLATQEEPAHFNHKAALGIVYTPPRQLVPGPAAPGDLTIYGSNNNVDIALYKGRLFMGYRTAPTHFASPETLLHIVSTEDRETWTHETTIKVSAADMREPRFMVFKGKLFFYFFEAGASMADFAPKSIYACERTKDGAWTEPREIFEPGHVVWRPKAHDDTAYMSVYYGAGLYDASTTPGKVRLLTSDDGYEWTPIADTPQVDRPYASECAYEFDDDGTFYATVRIEAEGSLVCRASMDNLGEWETKYTPYKYDSALMFRHGDDFFVIARRNVAGTFMRDYPLLPKKARQIASLVRYSLTRKRTALYKLNKEELTLDPLFDFPSSGDTAFPGLVQLEPDKYYMVNYSSPLDGPDWPWIGGQLFGSNLYGMEINFKEIEVEE